MSFTILLKASSCSLLCEATCVSVGGWSNLSLVAPPFCSLFSLENYSLILFVVDILTLIFILLISNFFSWLFFRSFICFQFHLSIPIN
jgi:hypothetical protein